MIEAGRIQLDDRRSRPSVLFVATGAGSLADARVITSFLRQPSLQRFVTFQTFGIGRAWLLELVTAGAFQQAFEPFVRGGEFAGRDKLGSCLGCRDERRCRQECQE